MVLRMLSKHVPRSTVLLAAGTAVCSLVATQAPARAQTGGVVVIGPGQAPGSMGSMGQGAPRSKYEPPGNAVYHGASIPDTWDEQGLRRQLDQYKAVAGKRLAVITWFASLYEKGSMTGWRHNYAATLARIKRLGAISLIKFSVQDYAYDQTHKMAGVKQIADGVYDAYFEEFADTIRDFGDPVFISINHEMNGTWYPYSEAYPGSTSTAADYVAMWRHIVDIFRRHNANNAAFVWSPNVPDVGPVPYTKYYPGDDYVDWVGVSFYSGNPIGNLNEIYKTYAQRKPIFITEWATAPEKSKYYPQFPGDAKWVDSFFKALETNYPRVKAISWFQYNKEDGNYLLQRDPAQQQVYDADIQNPRYVDSAANLLTQPPGGVDIPRLDVPGREIVLQEKTPPRQPAVQQVPVESVPVQEPARPRVKLKFVPTEQVPVSR